MSASSIPSARTLRSSTSSGAIKSPARVSCATVVRSVCPPIVRAGKITRSFPPSERGARRVEDAVALVAGAPPLAHRKRRAGEHHCASERDGELAADEPPPRALEHRPVARRDLLAAQPTLEFRDERVDRRISLFGRAHGRLRDDRVEVGVDPLARSREPRRARQGLLEDDAQRLRELVERQHARRPHRRQLKQDEPEPGDSPRGYQAAVRPRTSTCRHFIDAASVPSARGSSASWRARPPRRARCGRCRSRSPSRAARRRSPGRGCSRA